MRAEFAGLPLRSVTFTRSRGWGADTSVVEAIVPGGFDIEKPEPDDSTRAIDRPDPSAFELDSGPPIPGREATADPTSGRLAPFGYLCLGESIEGLEAQESQADRGPWRMVVGPLFVVAVEEIKVSTGGVDGATGAGPRIVAIRLVDERYFWPRGIVGRWSFNRKLASGVPALDSHKPGSTRENPLPYTRREIAELCVQALPRTPTLAEAPAGWADLNGPVELPRFGRAVDCLAQLAQGSGLEEPCLRLDGTVALHLADDSKLGAMTLGYAPDGKGPNEEPIPESLVLWKDGAGEGRSAEPSWPEPWALVVGGERIATVAVDDAEPVLMLPPDNRVRPLTEEIVRKLTGGAYGLPWLAKFVLRPSAYQSNVNVDPEVASLLADQAWKLWRLRDAVKLVGDEFVPGENAHLLPLRDRAETDESGRRLPVQVETFSFKAVHGALKGNPGLTRLNQIKILAQEVRDTITPEVVAGRRRRVKFLGSAGTSAVLDSRSVFEARPGGPDESGKFNELSGIFGEIGLEAFQDALSRAREMDQWRGTPNGDAIADSLKQLALEELQLEEELGGAAGRDELLLAAYEVLEVEEQLRDAIEARELLPGDENDPALLRRALQDEQNKAIRDAMLAKLLELSRKIRAETEERRNREEETGLRGPEYDDKGRLVKITVAPEDVGLVRYTNQLRKVDAGAQVVSEAAGVVRTSDLAGVISPDTCGDLSRAFFIPAPVRLVFGTTLRPKVDRPPPPPGSTPTSDPTAGDPQEDSTNDLGSRPITGGDNVIPEVLSDQESYYASAWQRTARHVATPRPVKECPLSDAVRLEDPSLVELVTLDGKSNRGQLDDRAEAMAREAFSAPDVVRSRRAIVGHLWPVQCDGLVRAVEIRTRFEAGVPCGFETLIAAGGSTAPGPATVGRTVDRRSQVTAREGLLP